MLTSPTSNIVLFIWICAHILVNANLTNSYILPGQPKDDGKPGDYLCKDCGYVYTKGPAAWAKETDKYKCPVRL